MSNNNDPGNGKKPFTWLMVYFGLAYFCQHFAQSGLLAQPMKFYFKEVLLYGPQEFAAFQASLVFPWMIKPLYGMISDYFPLLGYRRKSYLLLLNVLAAGGFLLISGVSTAGAIWLALLITATCTAFSDVAIDGLMVELGNKTGRTSQFQSMQWIWFNVAAVLSSLLGGYLIAWLGAASAFHWAGALTCSFPLAVVVTTWLWVTEERANVPSAQLRTETNKSLKQALKSKTLWIVIGFIVFWQFSPSIGTPFYYYQTDVLKFSQKFIGQLDAIGYLSAVAGAVFFQRRLAKRYTTKKLLVWSAIVGVIGTLSYLLLLDPLTTATPAMAIGITVVFGAAAQVAMLTTLNLAAEACPKRVEAMTFAVLMSIFNFAAQGSGIFGAWLYERASSGPAATGWRWTEWLYQHTVGGFFGLFTNAFVPLILLSAIFTALCLPLIRFLPDPQVDE